MKMQHGFFSFMFGKGSGNEPPKQKKPRRVSVGAYSQSNVLQERMKEQKLTHGETVTANLSPVRLEMDFGHMTMYFCPMKAVEITLSLNPGDGGRIPDEAKVDGLTVPPNFRNGFYTLKNVTLTSNGVIQVQATSATEWERL